MNKETTPPRICGSCFFAFALAFSPVAASAQSEADRLGEEFFESKIRPVLIDSCYECHSKEAGENKGGLTLDSRYGMRIGGNSGIGIVPGKPDESWIWLAVSHAEPDYEMPPADVKLPDQVIEDFRKWIEMGAPDPREEEKEVITEIDIDKGKEFWSFQRPIRQAVPEAADTNWAGSPIDRFVFAKLRAEGLQPAGPAAARDLLRRIHFDLTGLPPDKDFAWHFHDAWADDPSEAVKAVVDQLLLSRHFGERWAQHWFDVARFAESNGKGANQAYPEAWRFRDYVIDSFNQDKPYDRFIAEQLAGDLLPAGSDRERQNNLIATGFLALGPKNLREKSHRQFLMDMVDEQIDATSKAFLGLTVSCARCHDHKMEPIPTADYYSMAGIFLSSKTHYGTDGIGGKFNAGDLIELPVHEASNQTYSVEEISEMQDQLAQVNLALSQFHESKQSRKKGEAPEADDASPNKMASDKSKRGIAKRYRSRKSELEEKLASISANGSLKAFTMGMSEREQIANTHVLVRGEVDSPAQEVPRGFLQVLEPVGMNIPEESSGRLELAKWIASQRNPVTARVLVNRVWEKLFGRGLVATVDNFGMTGATPTHPELLDHLAIEFMEDGWSVKNLIRRIILTRTYKLSSQFNLENSEVDPENTFLWRSAPRRLDAEAFRDSILLASGQLQRDPPDRSPVADLGLEELGRKGSVDPLSDFPPYRSVYLPRLRDSMPEFLDLFDGADPNVVTGKRDVSGGAEQSLFLMNSPFMVSQARHFADQLRGQSDKIGDQVKAAFWQAYGRDPEKAEFESAIRFYREFVGDDKEREARFLNLFCQGLLCSAEFRHLN